MHDRYVQLFDRLSSTEAAGLWSRLHSAGLLRSPPPPAPTGTLLGETCRGLMHAEVVVSIADRPEMHWCRILDKLLERPRYIARMGERGERPTDATGTELTTQHRRGEPLGTGQLPYRIVATVRVPTRTDPRIITRVQLPNPKTPGSAAYARYELYRVGMTVTEFVRAGGKAPDIRYDSLHGFIELDLPGAEQ